MAGSRLPRRAFTTGSAFGEGQPNNTSARSATGEGRMTLTERTSNALARLPNDIADDEDEDEYDPRAPPFPNYSSRQESRTSNTTYAQFNTYGAQPARRDRWNNNVITNSEDVHLGHDYFPGSTIPEGTSEWIDNEISGGRGIHLGHIFRGPGSNPSDLPRRSWTVTVDARDPAAFARSTANETRRGPGENRARRDPDESAYGENPKRRENDRRPKGPDPGRRGTTRHA